MEVTETSAFACATIKDESGRIIAVAHKYEDKQGFPDFIEKSQTSAIGRALALVGFGTQFTADELSEGERLADSPVVRQAEPARPNPQEKIAQALNVVITPEGSLVARSNRIEQPPLDGTAGVYLPGEVTFSGGYLAGKKVKDVDMKEAEKHVAYFADMAAKKGVPVSMTQQLIAEAVEAFWSEVASLAFEEEQARLDDVRSSK